MILARNSDPDIVDIVRDRLEGVTMVIGKTNFHRLRHQTRGGWSDTIDCLRQSASFAPLVLLYAGHAANKRMSWFTLHSTRKSTRQLIVFITSICEIMFISIGWDPMGNWTIDNSTHPICCSDIIYHYYYRNTRTCWNNFKDKDIALLLMVRI